MTSPMDQETLEKIGGKVKWIEVPYTTTKLSVETGKNRWQTAGGDTIIARVEVGKEADPVAVFNATREWLKQLAVEANKVTLDKLLALYNKYHKVAPSQPTLPVPPKKASVKTGPAPVVSDDEDIFDVDTSFMPGAIVVGFDVLSYQGEARFTSRGVEKGDIPKADVSAGRTQQVIGKLDTYVSATIDEIQELAVRNNAGLAPMISLMSEKLEAARLLIGRGREKAIWNGAKVKGQDIGIDGWFSKFSTTASLYNAKAPTVGKQATVATKESAVTWTAKLALASGKGAMYIMEDISDAIAYVERLKQYKVKKIIFPQTWMIKLSTLPYSAQNPTPIIAVLRNALPGVEFVGTTALDSAYNTDLSSDGFIVVDNDKKNFIIADPEPINFLPAFTGKDGTVEQVARMQTAGLMSKHVSAAAYYTGI